MQKPPDSMGLWDLASVSKQILWVGLGVKKKKKESKGACLEGPCKFSDLESTFKEKKSLILYY